MYGVLLMEKGVQGFLLSKHTALHGALKWVTGKHIFSYDIFNPGWGFSLFGTRMADNDSFTLWFVLALAHENIKDCIAYEL